MRIMYDGITPSGLPHDGDIYASYIDGRWPNFHQLAALFPGKIHVSIAVDPAHDAQVLDVERYDATPAQSVDWVIRQRRNGGDPTVYCNTATIPQVHDAFLSRNIPFPHIWEANYDGVATLNPNTVAKQYMNRPAFDRSVVADYWPGIDPKPKPKPQPTPNGGRMLTDQDRADIRQIVLEEFKLFMRDRQGHQVGPDTIIAERLAPIESKLDTILSKLPK